MKIDLAKEREFAALNERLEQGADPEGYAERQARALQRYAERQERALPFWQRQKVGLKRGMGGLAMAILGGIVSAAMLMGVAAVWSFLSPGDKVTPSIHPPLRAHAQVSAPTQKPAARPTWAEAVSGVKPTHTEAEWKQILVAGSIDSNPPPAYMRDTGIANTKATTNP